ncbi:MAG: hypothetical protein IJ315_04040 [Firmicutes bacterium]|nr:hypothetical protein [Bacillota bacterium]
MGRYFTLALKIFLLQKIEILVGKLPPRKAKIWGMPHKNAKKEGHAPENHQKRGAFCPHIQSFSGADSKKKGICHEPAIFI